MSLPRTRTFFLAGLLAGSLLSQASDNTLRTLTTEGVAFKLPPGWEWQSEAATNIAIKKDVKIKDQTYTITGEMVYQAEGFLEDTISGIEKKVKASKGDLKDLKVTRGEKFAGNPAVLVSYVRVRGEKQDEFEDERQYLFRRNNALYTWTERAHRQVASQASGALSSARSAITFTMKDSSRAPKTFTDEAIKYTIPPDWEYDKVEPSKDPKFVNPILRVETVYTLKGTPWRVGIQLFAIKDTRTLDDLEKTAKDDATRQYKDVEDYKFQDKQSFNGEKSFVVSFAGKFNPEGPAPEQPKTRRRDYVMKRKGYVFRWVETMPDAANNPAVEALLKKAREGLSFL